MPPWGQGNGSMRRLNLNLNLTGVIVTLAVGVLLPVLLSTAVGIVALVLAKDTGGIVTGVLVICFHHHRHRKRPGGTGVDQYTRSDWPGPRQILSRMSRTNSGRHSARFASTPKLSNRANSPTTPNRLRTVWPRSCVKRNGWTSWSIGF